MVKSVENGIGGMAGELVWVQRGNATWWPGQILYRDELPEDCMPAPKPVVPIILIGKDDATVEWYNLEKSKKVKAFRCGEFDNLIEKAKASAFNLSKKASQREHAIRQALELESANSSSSSLHSSEESESRDGSNSAPQLSQSAVSLKEPGHGKETGDDSEDDRIGGAKQTVSDLLSTGSNKISGESTKNDSVVINNLVSTGVSAQWLFEVPLVAKGKRSAGRAKIVDRPSSRIVAAAQSSQSSRVDTISFGNGSNSTTSGLRIAQDITIEWRLRGKRNQLSRKMGGSRRHVDPNRIGGSLITDMDDNLVNSRSIAENDLANRRMWTWNTHRRELSRKGSTTHEMKAPQRRLPGWQDVDVEDKSDVQPQCVPYISLMSTTYGASIFGHPITVDALDDGSCKYLLDRGSEMSHNTNEALAFQGGDMVYTKRPRGRPRKQNMPCLEKMKKLSSLKPSEENTHREEYKPLVQKIETLSVACVPLKVVFSRINSDLSRTMHPPSRFNQSHT